MGERKKNKHVSQREIKKVLRVHVCFLVLFFVKFSPYSHGVFQANLGRLTKGLVRGERLEAFNIHRVLHVCILSELRRG